MAGLRPSVVVAIFAICVVGLASAEWGPWRPWDECDCKSERQSRVRYCIGAISTCFGPDEEWRDCDDDCGLTNGEIAGIVVGAVVALFLIIICIVICCWCGCCYGCEGMNMRRWGSDSSLGGGYGRNHRTVVVAPAPQPPPVIHAPPVAQVIQARPQISFATAIPQAQPMQTMQMAVVQRASQPIYGIMA